MLKTVTLAALATLAPCAAAVADAPLPGSEIKKRIAGKVFKGWQGYYRCEAFKLTFFKDGAFEYVCEEVLGVATANTTERGKWSVSGNRLCTQDRIRGRFCAPVTVSGTRMRWGDGRFR